MEICGQFLFRQLMTIRPKAICALGSTAAKALLATKDGVTQIARALAQVARHSGDRDVSSVVSVAPLQSEREARGLGRFEEGSAFRLRLKSVGRTLGIRRESSDCFITFEGPEGSGKSTQLRMLAARLRSEGREVFETAEPGGTPIGMQIRRVLLDAKNQEMFPVTELLLMFACRAQNVDQWILPALAKRQIVLSDRFTDSTLVYQGIARGLGSEVVYEVDRIACRGLVPGSDAGDRCRYRDGLEARARAQPAESGRRECRNAD